MKMRLRVVILSICACLAAAARAQNAPFLEAVQKNRAGIAVKDGKLSGPGADVLRAALAEAQFVLMGEDHGVAKIPEFGAALCAELAPRGFHHMALEVGPNTAPELERFARSAEGAKQISEFLKKYPQSVPFYNWREEFAMLQECERSGGSEGMTLWGVDQEFQGASGFLLDKILATNPGREAAAAIQALRRENGEERATAAKTGNPWDLFMTSAKLEELDRARDLLAKQGNAEAQQILTALLVSRDVYLKNKAADYYNSNRQRALLMKQNFVSPFSQAMQRGPAPPKVLFKFGGMHMFRGLNPLHSSELGNLAGEFAEAHDLKSVHILIFGVKGVQAHFAGIGKPSQAAPFDNTSEKDSDFPFLRPFFENQVAGSWTIYDLRALRTGFSQFGKIDPEFERIIFGYDFVVLVPEATASHDME